MKHSRACVRWGLAVLALLLSPIVVIFGMPLMVGIGLDIFDVAGEAPFVLALCAPVAVVLLRRLLRAAWLGRAIALVRSRLHLGHAADLIHAP